MHNEKILSLKNSMIISIFVVNIALKQISLDALRKWPRKVFFMTEENTSSEQSMRRFIKAEMPSLSDDVLDSVIAEIDFARSQYTRYSRSKKATNSRFTYKSKKASCLRIKNKAQELKEESQNADLMLLDEMHDYVGSKEFQDEVTAKLERLSTACEVLLKTVPTFVEKGRPLDRILYDWVLNMLRIYEDLFKPKAIDHRKNGKFLRFLTRWKPEGFPVAGDPLSPRTIERILHFRKFYKEDLRNTFMPENPYVFNQAVANRKGPTD